MTQWQPQQQHNPGREPWRPPAGPPQYQYGPPAVPPARRLPPYPSRLARFPVQLIPHQKRRRGRGHSLGYYVYLGNHPLAVMLALFATMLAWCLIAEWVLLVGMLWLMWCWLVTLGWLVTLPFAALTRR